MRTLKSVVGLVVLFVLIAAPPAHAWWDWLDDLSGPGKFHGWQFQVRAVCFGGESAPKRILDDLKRARGLIDKLVASSSESPEQLRSDLSAAAQAWRDLAVDLNATTLTFPVLSDDERTKAAAGAQSVQRVLGEVLERVPSGQVEANRFARIDTAPVTTALNMVEADVRLAITRLTQATAAANSSAILVSGCSTSTERRSSIDIAVSVLTAGGNPGFANNEPVRLTMLMPVFSYRVFRDPRYDVLDAGFGGGVYWFTSKGFESISGVVLEPGYLDFNAPSKLRAGSGAMRFLGIPSFRFALIDFPSGFAPAAFAGTGEHNTRIVGELVKSWGVFFTFDPFIKRPPFDK
jgi:hypothetical protein